jgi:hypothetical protein
VILDRDAATIIVDHNAAISLENDVDLGAIASNCLIDRVVDRFVDKMVEASGTGGPDVHGWSFSYRVEAFEYLDGTGVVAH